MSLRAPRPVAVLAALALSAAALPGGVGRPDQAPAQGVRGGADSVKVRVAGVARRTGAEETGPRVEVRVELAHARGFHSWPDEPVVPPELAGLNAIATSIEPVSLPDGATVEEIGWPDPVRVTVRYGESPLEILSFVDTTTAVVRLRLASEPEADAVARFRVQLQSCDEQYCYPPRRVEVTAPIPRESTNGERVP